MKMGVYHFLIVSLLVCLASRVLAQESISNMGSQLGGIGTGSIQISPLGEFLSTTINNNPAKPITGLRGCFAALWTEVAGKTHAVMLQGSVAPSKTSVVSKIQKIEFKNQGSLTKFKFSDPSVPITVNVTAFSPIIPHDLKNSNLPIMLYIVTLVNNARGPVNASVAFSWENLLGVGGNKINGTVSDRTGNTVKVIPNFAGLFGLKMERPAKQINDPANRLEYNTYGEYSLMALAPTGDTVVKTASWNASADTISWWNEFTMLGTVSETVASGQEKSIHPAGVVSLKCALRNGESRTFPIAVAWYTPRQYVSGGSEYGHQYQKNFDNSLEVAQYGLENWQNLLATSEEWQNELLNSTVPAPITSKLLSAIANLTRHSILTRDDANTADAGDPIFSLVQNGSELGLSGQSPESIEALSTFYPGLFGKLLIQYELNQFATGQLPEFLGSLDEVIGKPNKDQSDKSMSVESLSRWIHLVADYYRLTGDTQFLNRFYPVVKHAVESYIRSNSAKAGVDTSKQPIPTTIGADNTQLEAANYLASQIGDKSFSGELEKFQKANGLLVADLSLSNRFGLSELSNYIGFNLDVPGGTLRLVPKFTGSERVVRAPIFTPRFWAYVTASTSLSIVRMSFRVDRFSPTATYIPTAKRTANSSAPISPRTSNNSMVGSFLILRSVILPVGREAVPSVQASIGRAPVPGTALRKGDIVVFTFDAPVQLTTGQRIDFVIR